MKPTATLSVSGTFLVEENRPVLYVGNGRVGILNANPQYELDVSGTVHATQFFTTSDERFKTDIKPITEALKGILSINGYSYILKSDGSHQYGVLAQEIENVFPYLVSTDSDGFKAVNYNGLIAPIIQSLHELNTKVQTLETLSSSNANRLEALEKKIQ
ncbi:MAG: tail fiber domain-containing protein [bacterium]